MYAKYEKKKEIYLNAQGQVLLHFKAAEKKHSQPFGRLGDKNNVNHTPDGI